MKRWALMITLLASVAMILATPMQTMGKGKPDNPGGGGKPAQDYGDLFVLYRDARGVPYLTQEVSGTGSCQQPLPSDTCVSVPPAGCVLVAGEKDGILDPNVLVIPVNPATCAVLVECATCTQEVDFGRISDVRSPDSVFEAQLEDAVFKLATADCISMDPAGRLVTSTVAGDVVSTATIDSPLQNLAIYRQLMLHGPSGISNLLEPLEPYYLNTVARALGAASDKTGKVTVDMVVYVNQIMGLTAQGVSALGDPICQENREEVKGQVKLVEKCYLDYGIYVYDRTTNFGALPNPAYIPENNPQLGMFEYLAEGEPPTFEIKQDSILSTVFGTEVGFEDGNIGGFAQAADDARAVIDFMHTWPVPGDAATPVVCTASSPIVTYDVSISDVSGLQVPRNIVDGSEGREFTVTVANAGPDPATGTVTVTADAGNGVLIAGSPWIYEFDLAQGGSWSQIQFFSINLGARTTIAWTATVAAQYDVNLGNNTVTAISSVKVTGSGGGGRP